MFMACHRLLNHFRTIKPAPLISPCNTRLTRFFCTKNEEELKPEDRFGDYASDLASKYPEDDCDDVFKSSSMTISTVTQQMKTFINNHEFEKAHEVFNEFKKRKKPSVYMYKLFFASAARLGKVKEAFSIYNDLKKRGLYADNAMYTSLFYACAKCPDSNLALPIANKLLEYLFQNEKRKPNKININTILLAYGRHGDISTVLKLVDKLEEDKIKLTCETYNIVLQSCISLQNTGLRFAILIWHHMLMKNISPNLITFTTILRCVRDCSLGDSDLSEEFIKSVLGNYSNEKIAQRPEEKLMSGELVINSAEESRVICERDQRGGDLKEANSLDNNYESATVLDVQSDAREIIRSGENISRDMIVDIENEKIQLNSQTVEADSSHDCSLAPKNKEESQDITHNETAASEESVENFEEPIHVSNTEGKNQVTETQSEVGFVSEVETHEINDSDLPNLLTLKRPGKSILKFGDFSTPENRLMLLGGLDGFLKTVTDYKVKPDIKLYSLLLRCIPSTRESEEKLMKQMKTSRVKVDTTFLNILIKRRILRNEESTPENLMDLYKKYKCAPDLVTVGTIALGCVTHESGKNCIQLARTHNIRLNNMILGCLLGNAAKIGDMAYVSDILKAGKEDDTEFDARFVSILRSIVQKEKIKRKESVC